MHPPADCRLCDLHKGRTAIVLPAGDPSAKVCLVGEAPGEMEDIKGSPFVGRAGKLLDRILEEEGVDRASLLITNTVKCRPPGNRDPTEEEMAACRPFLIDELRGREFVVALGRSACRSLAGINAPMKEIANKKMELDLGDEKLIFIPTYHPAACIYSKAARDALKETVRMIKGLL